MGKKLTVEQATAIVLEHSVKNRKSISESIKLLWSSHLSGLSDGAIASLAQYGLGQLCSQQACMSGAHRPPETVVQMEIKQIGGWLQRGGRPATEIKIIAERIELESADGGRKPYVEFTIADCSAYLARNQAQIAGLSRRNAAVRTGMKLLARTGAKDIAHLPPPLYAKAVVALAKAVQKPAEPAPNKKSQKAA